MIEKFLNEAKKIDTLKANDIECFREKARIIVEALSVLQLSSNKTGNDKRFWLLQLFKEIVSFSYDAGINRNFEYEAQVYVTLVLKEATEIARNVFSDDERNLLPFLRHYYIYLYDEPARTNLRVEMEDIERRVKSGD